MRVPGGGWQRPGVRRGGGAFAAPELFPVPAKQAPEHEQSDHDDRESFVSPEKALWGRGKGGANAGNQPALGLVGGKE